VHRIAVAIMKILQKKILEKEFVEILEILSNISENLEEPQLLISTALKIKFSRKKYNKLENDFKLIFIQNKQVKKTKKAKSRSSLFIKKKPKEEKEENMNTNNSPKKKSSF
jgi:uncharacterized protein involved in outer membrane biogenesis